MGKAASVATYNRRVRYLGVDPGGRRLGLAVADDAGDVASPFAVVAYGGVAAAARMIAETADEVGAARVVIGLPTLEDGSEAPGGRRSRLLAEALYALGVEVDLQSEFLTTAEARRRARDAGRRPECAIDDIAAQVILEEFLEGRRTAPGA